MHVENSSSGHCVYAVSIVGGGTAPEVCDGMFKYMRNTSTKISYVCQCISMQVIAGFDLQKVHKVWIHNVI
jgi:hypothetical protein